MHDQEKYVSYLVRSKSKNSVRPVLLKKLLTALAAGDEEKASLLERHLWPFTPKNFRPL